VERFESVTILFSDIVEYTSLSTRLEPEQIVVMLNHVYSLYDTICQEEGVFKVETIGDGFMAVGGAPEKCEPLEAAERVARVALRMMQVRCTRSRAGLLRTAPVPSHALALPKACACFLPCMAVEP
jgi:class 3 adenylate cyclase